LGRAKAVAVIGAGYVGLTLSTFLASRGVKTICVEKDEVKAEKICRGTPPIYEEGLEELLRKTLSEHMLEVRTRLDRAEEDVDIFFITVGTPVGPDRVPDLSQVRGAAVDVGDALARRRVGRPLVVLKSTVPPLTTWEVVRPLIEERSGKSCGEGFHLCFNPEFLREGSALADTANPDRIIIGAEQKEAAYVLQDFYRELYAPRAIPTIITNTVNAELTKLATNAFLAMKISFINLIARICERVEGGDVVEVARGLGLDPRIGGHFLRAGIGFGGSCLPKDLRALAGSAEKLGLDASLLRATLELNDSQRLSVVEMAEAALGGIGGKRIALLGLAFKPGTDDVRESPAVAIARELSSRGAEVHVHDPKALESGRQVLGDSVAYHSNLDSCLTEADAAIIATEWKEYATLSPSKVKALMRRPLIIDGRRVLDPPVWCAEGFEYYAVGLSHRRPSRWIVSK
jgi:UDPglucose 6-dehydrogenase